ncbi:MAG: hypothetical protein JJU28_22520 [Cyclobacteriaceae bacterium]|nr:hypothetical protein [Cyclobacteriaceae bacterium]
MLSITIRRFWIKLTRWEYWPTWIVYFPVFVYYLYLSLKSGSLLFFTRVNPEMEMGGLFGASKYRQLEHLSDDFKPITLLFQPGIASQDLLDKLNRAGIKYPFILKPDLAERGRGVHLVEDESYLKNLLTKVSYPFIVQEYIQGEFEAGVFVYKIPGNTKIEIPSLVIKEFLTVQGDGRSSLRELMLKKDRALMALPKLSKRLGSKMFEIPPDNEEIHLEPIGNHNRGTKFRDGRHLIHPGMYDFYAGIVRQLPDFFYGRFDLRANSQHVFLQNRNIKILEVNGVNAEPAHIYDPGTSLMSGIVTLLKHWNIIYNIARANQSNGYPLQTYKEALQHYWQWRKAVRI